MRMYCVTVVYRITEQTGLDNQSARFSIRSAFMRTLWIYYGGKHMFPLINPPVYIGALEISQIVVLGRTYIAPPLP